MTLSCPITIFVIFFGVAVGSASLSSAQTDGPKPPVKIKLAKVELLVDDKPAQAAGKLYRSTPAGIRRKLVAEIDSQGNLTLPVECESSDQFFAELVLMLVFPLDRLKPCNELLRFKYRRVEVRSAEVPGVEGLQLASAQDPAQALMNYEKLLGYARAANKPELEWVASEGAIKAAARLLGDSTGDLYLARDPTRRSQLVFSPTGVAQIKKIQTLSNIPATGTLDSRTQQILRDLKM